MPTVALFHLSLKLNTVYRGSSVVYPLTTDKMSGEKRIDVTCRLRLQKN